MASNVEPLVPGTCNKDLKMDRMSKSRELLFRLEVLMEETAKMFGLLQMPAPGDIVSCSNPSD